ncbi:pyridoxal-dependent decarboxylase conserved domain protein [Apiospora kogelbergensis]|uniref:Pyridoxal-dependent decarboxylase conserved domain protein n=1 Tax=Apiospora kogelbergensis TaxID=1337665 RepID=A0AAW0R0I6_9PEZI
MTSTKPVPNGTTSSQSRSENTAYNTTATHEDKSHQIISSYFIGPQAENLGYFKENIHAILEELEKARRSYFPGDGKFISEKTQQTKAFIQSKDKLKNAVRKASSIIARASIPFWSPRYQAHMCTDMSMASLLGYFMTMLYNPNNVAIEASPVSTVAEIEVGEQLCQLFGYNILEDNRDAPTGWGHVTCGGSVANLESIWVARNLKFYPLALRKAFDPHQKLNFLSENFYVETCKGERKLFTHLSNWELLNLKPSDVLDLPDRLYQEHGVSTQFISKVMNEFTIQSTGKDELERELGLTKPCQYILSNTRHYSWPKGAAIAGLGSDNVIGIPVDQGARICLKKLKDRLRHNLKEKQPVLAVVAIIGSTEEGAVDRLSDILALRKQFQSEGLSFLVHADAAWGGYFCSMLPKDYQPGDCTNLPTEMGTTDGFVPDASLRVETQEDLYAMRFADSITVDPHKAGYIPYPAGGLCYRDGRMRFLVTWTCPYVARGSVTSIGVYGVEGSKPGAAAMSTWLANKTIGLNPEGYGALLGEVTWTCTRLSAEWAALTDPSSPFTCVPFNMLPSELSENTTEERVQAEKARIRSEIVNKTNAQIIKEDAHRRDEDKAMTLMRALGSDLNINAFALNFRYEDGSLNEDIEEANYLMQRVVGALSVESPNDRPAAIPLFLTSTEFSDELYGDCKTTFVERLGLAPSKQDLMVLRNVVMSPFPTDQNFIRELAGIFYDVVEKETEIVRKRNNMAPDIHKFLMQGMTNIYLIHLPMFHVANHRQQLIVSASFNARAKAKYDALKRSNPTEPLILVTKQKVMLKDVAGRSGKFKAQIMTQASGIVLQDVDVSLKATVVSRPLNSKFRLEKYPDTYMPFYLYGSANEANIDHVIVRAPNTQLSAGRCKIDFYQEVEDTIWDHKLVLLIENVREEPMQPFPPNSDIGSKNGAIVAHESYHAEAKAAAKQTAKGRISIGVKAGRLDAVKQEEEEVPEENDLYKDEITRSRGQPSDGYGQNGNSSKIHKALSHEDDSSPRLHTTARAVNSETQSGSARGSQFFFRPGATFKVSVWKDHDRSQRDTFDIQGLQTCGNFVGRGTLTLGDSVFVDSEAMNADRFKKVEKINEWRHEFDQIGRELV